jgi:hypothetical protein
MAAEKDRKLFECARTGNVAQFVSFGPQLPVAQRFALVSGYRSQHRFSNASAAVAALLASSSEGSVNVRSFHPNRPMGNRFTYGLTDPNAVLKEIHRNANEGLYSIVNETINVHDGGVSGVAYGGILEFAPDDTPRCVERPGVASLPRRFALRVLELVYGFTPSLPYGDDRRVEFSLHPLRRGVGHDHTIIWEIQTATKIALRPSHHWPNLFSRMLGDKAYGLIVAALNGARVPRTLVISRRVAPFEFGQTTGTSEAWIRTCPMEQTPGKFPTFRGWRDPYELLAGVDPEATAISSVLAQDGIDAKWSGAFVLQADGSPLVEGVRGGGEKFMKGEEPPRKLPKEIKHAVMAISARLCRKLGDVRFEWVHDGRNVWIVQLHAGRSAVQAHVVFPGEPAVFRKFEVSNGLETLRTFLEQIDRSREGVLLIGHVGLTSHFGDIIRQARIPARLASSPDL